MRKRYILICTIAALILFAGNWAFAAALKCEDYCADKSLGEPPDTTCLCNPLRYDTLEDLINAVLGFIFWLGLVIAPILLTVAGFLFVTSAGNSRQLEKAKNLLIYTFIGLAVLLVARGLVAVLLSILGAKT